MPRKPNRPCAYSGCPELTDDYYCDNEQCIMALLVGVIRSERFCYGIIWDYIENGLILKWLQRLKEIDEIADSYLLKK